MGKVAGEEQLLREDTERGERRCPRRLGPEMGGMAGVRMDRGRTGVIQRLGKTASRVGALRSQPSNLSARRKTQENPRGREGGIGAGQRGGVGQTHSCPDVQER